MSDSFHLKFAAVMFDLDGTLIDSAPDLAGAVNALRIGRGLAALPLSVLRPFASHGAKGLLGAGLGVTPDDDEFESLKDAFLDYYQTHNCVKTALFLHIDAALMHLEQRDIPWGIITNKHARFTEPLVRALNLYDRAAVVVSGDTTSHAKPHAKPLLYAAEQIGIAPAHIAYVGDDVRDILSARAAGYGGAFAAAYGYCENDDVAAWRADVVFMQPENLLTWVKTAFA